MKILYFAPVSWGWIKQRPHFIAENLAAMGNEVLYLCRVPFLRHRKETLVLNRHLRAVTLPVLPLALKLPVVEKFNNFLLRKRVPWREYDAVILGDPRLVYALPEKLDVPVIYDCMDNNPGFFTGRVKEHLHRAEKALLQRADRVICSAEALKKQLVESYGFAGKIDVVRNGASGNFLHSVSGSGEAAVPADFLYVGTIERWLEWDNLAAFARKYPEKNITLTGPVKYAPAGLPANILLTGRCSHDQVLSRLKQAKVLLLPFTVNELTRAVDPVKMYEYLACGGNVVSAWWEELEYFRSSGGVSFYRDPEEFEKAMCAAWESAGTRVENPAFLRENCWDQRAVAYCNILQNALLCREM